MCVPDESPRETNGPPAPAMRRNASAAVAAVATRAGAAAGPTTANRLAASGQRSRACPGPTSSRCSSAGAWVITTSKSPFAAARRICPDGATTVVRGAGPVQSDSSTASAPDCCTVYVVPSRKGAGPARQAAARRNTAATRFMPGNLPYRECSSGRPLARNGVRDGVDDRVPEWRRPEPGERHYHGCDGGPRVRGELRRFRAVHRRQRCGTACAIVPPPDRTGRRHPPLADLGSRHARQGDADRPTEVAGYIRYLCRLSVAVAQL